MCAPLQRAFGALGRQLWQVQDPHHRQNISSSCWWVSYSKWWWPGKMGWSYTSAMSLPVRGFCWCNCGVDHSWWSGMPSYYKLDWCWLINSFNCCSPLTLLKAPSYNLYSACCMKNCMIRTSLDGPTFEPVLLRCGMNIWQSSNRIWQYVSPLFPITSILTL